MAKVLIIGSGGREHSLCVKLAESPLVGQIFVSPGNAGTATSLKSSNVSLNLKNFEVVGKWCSENKISLVVVGPEDPLAAGIVDVLANHGEFVFCF